MKAWLENGGRLLQFEQHVGGTIPYWRKMKLLSAAPFTPATGPANGIFEIDKAAEAAVMPTTSVAPVLSADKTDAMTWVSK